MLNDKILNYAKERYEPLTKAVAMYRDRPAEIRNVVAEMGTELTPAQIEELVNQLEDILEMVDAGD